MIPYARVNPQDEEVQRLETSVINTFQSLINNPLLGNVTLKKAIVLTGGADTVVDHGLGRTPNGYIIVEASTDATIHKSATVNPMPTVSYIFNTSKTVTVNILFF